jgi:hypothetical protein
LRILINDKRKNNIEKEIENEKITIGVIGIRNKGKSFILQKLSNQTLQTGSMINTKGLSLKYYNRYVLLDSEGFESPVLINEINQNKESESNNQMLDKSRDKLFTKI